MPTAPPIIVAGMHRSGTTLLASLLEKCGVFMGMEQTGNRESVFFQNLNKDALDMLGCNWYCLDMLPETEKFYSHYQWLHDFMEKRLKSSLINEHFGCDDMALCEKINLWGWKDPRNSLLLPMWHRIFPDAIVLNIYRDGRDVALSLLTRELKREKGGAFLNKDEMTLRYISYFKLWEAYIKKIQEAIVCFKKSCTLQYERLISNPGGEMERLISAMDIPASVSFLDLASGVDNTRSGRYLKEDFSWTADMDIDTSLLGELGYL